jgi:hypothetical protein
LDGDGFREIVIKVCLHLTAGEIFYRKVTVIFMSRRSPSLPLAACRLPLAAWL